MFYSTCCLYLNKGSSVVYVYLFLFAVDVFVLTLVRSASNIAKWYVLNHGSSYVCIQLCLDGSILKVHQRLIFCCKKKSLKNKGISIITNTRA